MSKDFYTFTAMKIQADLVYSKNEVAEILNIHPRKLNRIAQKHNIEKVDNRYIFKGAFLIEHFKKEVSKDVQQVSKEVSRDIQEIPAGINPFESIKQQFERYKIEDIEDIDFTFNRKGELSALGNLIFVPKNRVYAEYTENEYQDAEQKLNEWYTLQTEITHQEEMFNVKLKSVEDIAEHYQTQFEYQRKQSDKILAIHQTLIDTIENQNKLALQRNFIEAKDKGLDKE
jgi:hypothetical protein